jgi:hypothetical protein
VGVTGTGVCLLSDTDTPPHSRDTLRPSYPRKSIRPANEGAARPSNEGAGKAGCPLHPRSVCEKWKHTEVTTGVGGSSRPSLRNGFNGFLRALLGDRAFLSPSSADATRVFTNLTPASGRQDHTTSPSASARFVLAREPRPSHPALHVRDDRETPL